MNFWILIMLLLIIIIISAYFFFKNFDNKVVRTSTAAMMAGVSMLAGGVAVDDGGLYDQATLVKNTYVCGGEVLCEGLFTIKVADEKNLQRDNNIIIYLEDKNKNRITPAWIDSIEYDTGTPTLVNNTVNVTTCSNTTLPNGSLGTICDVTQETYQEEVIVWGDKKLDPGINYVRIWTDQKPANVWVDWHLLIKNVPVESFGIRKNVDFSTQLTDDGVGWAPWGDSGQAPATGLYENLSVYYTFDDDDLTGSNPNDLVGRDDDGTNNGATTGASSDLGQAFNFDGTDDEVVVPNQGSFTAGKNYSFYARFKHDVNGSADTVWSWSNRGSTTSATYITLAVTAGNTLCVQTQENAPANAKQTCTPFQETNEEHTAVVTYNENTNNISFYLDGAYIASNTTDLPSASSMLMYIGELAWSSPNVNNWDGLISEYGFWEDRVLNLTDAQNLHNSGAGLPYEEFGVDYNFPYAFNITINSSEVDSDLTDFPVYVNMSNFPAGFWNKTRSDCGDVRVSNDSGSELAREVVWCNTTTEEGELHFKADSISSSTDTNFTIYYGNSSATDYAVTDPYGRNAVWSDYVAVFHFQEGTGTTTADATGNGNTGTLSSVDWVDGIAGYGVDFNANSDYITLTDGTIGTTYTQLTVSQLVNFDNFPSRVITLWDLYDNGGADRAEVIGWVNTDSKTYGQWFGDGTDANVGALFSMSADTFYQMSYVVDGATMKVYLDDTEKISATATGTMDISTPASTDLVIGNQVTTGATRGHDGIIDEARYSARNTSSSQISAEQSMFKTHSTFVTYGEEVNLSAPTNNAPTSTPNWINNSNYVGTNVQAWVNWTDADGDVVNITWSITKNGTAVSNGVETNVASNTSVNVANITAEADYEYTLYAQTDDGTSTSANNSNTTGVFLGIDTSSFCAGINVLEFKTNISRGTYNVNTNEYTEYNITATNTTSCVYSFNNTVGFSVDYTISTNISNETQRLRFNNSWINSTTNYTFTLANNDYVETNVTADIVGYNLLTGAFQPFTLTVTEAPS